MGQQIGKMEIMMLDFPGGPMMKNSPAITGDTGSIPGLGRSHMPGAALPAPRSHWSPLALEPMLHNSPPQWDGHALEEALSQQGRPSTAKNK